MTPKSRLTGTRTSDIDKDAYLSDLTSMAASIRSQETCNRRQVFRTGPAREASSRKTPRAGKTSRNNATGHDLILLASPITGHMVSSIAAAMEPCEFAAQGTALYDPDSNTDTSDLKGGCLFRRARRGLEQLHQITGRVLEQICRPPGPATMSLRNPIPAFLRTFTSRSRLLLCTIMRFQPPGSGLRPSGIGCEPPPGPLGGLRTSCRFSRTRMAKYGPDWAVTLNPR